VAETGLRKRKKTQARQHISDVATRLFQQRGFDAVSISEIAEAVGMSKPTVFAYFPRKEDIVFDRTAAVTATLVQTIRESEAPLQALRDLLAAPEAPGAFGTTPSEQKAFCALVAGSRVLQARARELAEELEAAVAEALRDRGIPDAPLHVALIAAAYRTIHVAAIRRLLAGDPPREVSAKRTSRLAHALDVINQVAAQLPEA
jgi:AcrR family transcriptional regulator